MKILTRLIQPIKKIKQVQWLKMELERLRIEQKQFGKKNNFVFGTEKIPDFIVPVPPNSLRATVGSPSLASYLIVADGWYFLISWLLKKRATILDIGCGCGKLARLFLHHPFIEKYIGLDNYGKSIQWCQKYITPLSSGKFQFILVDILSEAYNPQGKIRGRDFIFPIDDFEIDIAIAASLFTHLLEEDAINYLKQTKRVLKKDGILVASIHTDVPPGKRYSGDETRIDVKADYFAELAQSCGLIFDRRLGTLLGQDILIFRSS